MDSMTTLILPYKYTLLLGQYEDKLVIATPGEI
jgi:hypothetical protein